MEQSRFYAVHLSIFVDDKEREGIAAYYGKKGRASLTLVRLWAEQIIEAALDDMRNLGKEEDDDEQETV